MYGIGFISFFFLSISYLVTAMTALEPSLVLLTIVTIVALVSCILFLLWKQFNNREQKPNYLLWTKVHLALELHVKEALLDVLHNRGNDTSYVGLPDDQGQLHQYLQNWWSNLPLSDKKHLNAKILKQAQKDKLFPPNGQQVDSSTWDVSLIVIIIRNCVPILEPLNGWKTPHQKDNSKGANAARARDLRNDLKHGTLSDIDNKEKFDKYFDRMTDVTTLKRRRNNVI